jgi:hypothetical protein
MNEVVVVFYSNYYDKSVEIKEFFEKNHDNFRVLCVDNKEIREKILSDTTYGIKYVPSLLFLKEDGSMVIYEKETAIEYYNNLRESKKNDEERERNKIAFFSNNTKENPTPMPIMKEEPEKEEENDMLQSSMSIMEMAKAMETGRRA